MHFYGLRVIFYVRRSHAAEINGNITFDFDQGSEDRIRSIMNN
jgi:hypothetical protein